ncbi:hypothetical protein HaLaN_14524 [Haematococcus lacustris]|uniref:Uncharacterized protein n=1 Tax=Haematococcus lacustris TaxID=44745 RepID=A0A699ZG74_HAELA|nr:hypothetical protein HaLaN_14524 [Haematococcus lacustris]
MPCWHTSEKPEAPEVAHESEPPKPVHACLSKRTQDCPTAGALGGRPGAPSSAGTLTITCASMTSSHTKLATHSKVNSSQHYLRLGISTAF